MKDTIQSYVYVSTFTWLGDIHIVLS